MFSSMRIFNDTVRLLFRSRILPIFMIGLILFVGWESSSLYGQETIAVTLPLRNALTLSIYLFIAMMFISYEYARKLFHNGVSEALLVTEAGRKRINYKMLFGVMSIYSVMVSLLLGTIVIRSYLFYQIEDPGHEYIIYIIKHIFLNDFIIMELGSVIGISLASIHKRMHAYTLMCTLAILVSPWATSTAGIIDLSAVEGKGVGRAAFKFLSYFYVMPQILLKNPPYSEFGEPFLPYRFFIIGFWFALFFLFLSRTRELYSKYTVVSIIMCVAALLGYIYPCSRMQHTQDVYAEGGSEFIYVWETKEYQPQTRKADYKILEYDLNLRTRANLSVTADMKVSKSLKKYLMTLYRQYKVSEVKDQEGHLLEFTQDHEYIEIRNEKGYHITNIEMRYKGSSKACPANYQCCYLPGYYLYYPRAGYLNIYDELGNIQPQFVAEDTYFRVKTDSGNFISNLPKKNGLYRGKCDGFTLLRGFYKIEEFKNGNCLVYPYLDEWITHDGKKSEKESWAETFESVGKEIEKDGLKNTMIVADTVLDGSIGKANGKKQIFTNSCGVYYWSDKE